MRSKPDLFLQNCSKNPQQAVSLAVDFCILEFEA